MIVPVWEIPGDYAAAVGYSGCLDLKGRAPGTTLWSALAAITQEVVGAASSFADDRDDSFECIGHRNDRGPTHSVGASSCASSLRDRTTSVSRGYSDLDPVWFAGATGGMCALRTVVQHPMNLALTRKQTCPTAALMNTSEILQRIYRVEGGFAALRQGMTVTVVGCAATEVVYLVLLEYLRESLPVHQEASRDAAAGYAADVASRTLYNPISIVSLRQMTQYQFSHAAHHACPSSAWMSAETARLSAATVVRGLFREGGMRSLLCGLGMTLAIGSQYSALWWSCYNQLKRAWYAQADPLLKPHDPTSRFNWLTSRDDNLMLNSMASVTTSAITGVLFNPFFVMRANMQCSVRGTLMGTARSLYQRGGARVFFQGTYLNVTACVVDGILASTSYEYAKVFADRTQAKRTD